MSIRYRCEECGSVMKIRDSLAGTKGRCPKCRTKFEVPEVSTLSEDDYQTAMEQQSHSVIAGDSSPALHQAGDSPSGTTLEAGSNPKLVRGDQPSGILKDAPSAATEPAQPPAQEAESKTSRPQAKPPVARKPAIEEDDDDDDVAAAYMAQLAREALEEEEENEAPRKPSPAPKAVTPPTKPTAAPAPQEPAKPPVQQPVAPIAKAAPPEPAEAPVEAIEPADDELEAILEADEELPAEEFSPDFDAADFLLDDSDPNAKKSAGLSKAIEDPNKPVLDSMGRRYFGSGPKKAATVAEEEGASVTKQANVPLELKRREPINWKAVKKDALRKSPFLLLIAAIAGGTYWGVSSYYRPTLAYPRVAEVTGVVELDGKPFAGAVVHFTLLNATNGTSAKEVPIRIPDAIGITDADGQFAFTYLGKAGAPLGKGRVWLETVNAADANKVPTRYQTAGQDIREVREAGNESKFDLKLKNE